MFILLLGLGGLASVGCGGSGTSASTGGDQNNPTPALTALGTDSVLVGSEDLPLSIAGTNFISATQIFFGSTQVSPSFVDATTIRLTIPKSFLTTAKVVPITASNPTPGGGTSNSLNFTIKNPVPTLSTLSTTTAYVNSPDLTLTLEGKGFASGAQVHFGPNPLNAASTTDTQLSVVVPAALLTATGIIPVSVENPGPGGGASATLDFTIGNPVPTLSAFVASSVLVNSTNFVLEIDGKGFTAGARIRFGSDDLTPAAVTDTRISAAVPDALLTTARVVGVTVSNPEPLGGASNSLDFSVNNPVPQITSITPDTADALTDSDLTFSVTGTDFVEGATIDFGSQKMTPGSFNRNKLDVVIPAAGLATGGNISVTVTNPGPGGGPSNAINFRLNNPQPELTALSQSDVVAGSTPFDLILVGNKFVSTSTVDFGGNVLTPATVSKNEIMVNVPEAAFATGGVIQVKVVSPEPGGGPSGTIDFTINNPVPTIASISPSSITNTGSDQTISLVGTNFVSTSAVTIGTDSVTSSLVSKTQLNVTLPAATIATGATAGSLSFMVNNPAPAGGNSNASTLIVRDKATLSWERLANGTSTLPGTTTPFASFSSASVNQSGLAVFRGTSVLTTSDGTEESSTTTGVYTADLANGATLVKIADIATLVPAPNELTYGQSYAKFGGFPSTPNIDATSTLVGFNATHPPVISLVDGKGGSAGLYSNPDGVLDTGVGLFVTTLNNTYTYFQVPEMPAGTAFGAFPNSPAAVGGDTLVFKGDYLNGTAVAMGVYFRNVVSSSGEAPVSLIASTFSTLIPNSTRKFGYIGAPSAVDSTAVFVGYDRKDAPTMGGIYSAPITSVPTLTPLVTIGTTVPGETDTFTKFADPVSFDGRYVIFWGTWGTETTTRTLSCTDVPDAALSAFCSTTVYPTGSTTVEVPVKQGIFVYDTTQQTLVAIAKTGAGFNDFAYYRFVGTLPEEGAPTDVGGGGSGRGGGDTETEVSLEAPGFVLSPNLAVAGQSGTAYQAAFKANTGGVDGIYIATGSGTDTPGVKTAVDTTMAGTVVDYNAASTTMIKNLDLEHVGMSGSWLTIGSTLIDSATQIQSPGLYYTTLSTTN